MNLFKRSILFIILCSLLITPQVYTETTITLQKGETLYSISRKYNISVEKLLEYNKITDPTNIKIGAQIKIPGETKKVYHTLQKGETLYKLSRVYLVPVDEIIRANNISDISSLKVGQKILIPGAKAPQEGGVVIDSPSPFAWPHPGTREKLNDILTGVVIYGNSGDPIQSVCAGEVIWADPFRGYGKMLAVKTRDEYIYVYAGNEKLLKKVGDKVREGDRIAHLGQNSHDGKAKAYFFIYKNGKALDPEKRF